MMQRRRKATAEEIAQGQQEMEDAQKRLEKQMEEDGDLALEDAPCPKKGGTMKNQGTPSTTAKASIEDPTQVSTASSRTPEALGPKEPKVSTGPKKEPKPGEGSSLKPTPTSSRQKADGKGGGSGKEKFLERPEEHSISTPPRSPSTTVQRRAD